MHTSSGQTLTSRSIDSYLAVFRCDSFRSLTVSINKPFLSWMLLNAPKLTIQCDRLIMPRLPFKGLTLEPCSLTHLVLLCNAAIHRLFDCCVQLHDSAKRLLGKLKHLGLEYVEPCIAFGPLMVPFVENLIVFLGAQLDMLEIHVIT
jgi:hypothetical protein